MSVRLRLRRHAELKFRINIEARQQLHSTATARSGGKFQNPTISEAITKTSLVAKLTTTGSYIGIALDVLATRATIEKACSDGRERECARVKYIEYGGFVGRVFGGVIGTVAGVAGTQPESRVCLAVSAVPHGRLACAIVGSVTGAVVGEKVIGKVGEKFGAELFIRIYGEENSNGTD